MILHNESKLRDGLRHLMGFLVVSSDKLGKICVRVDELVVLGDCNVEDLSVHPFRLADKIVLVLYCGEHGIAPCTGPVDVDFRCAG